MAHKWYHPDIDFPDFDDLISDLGNDDSLLPPPSQLPPDTGGSGGRGNDGGQLEADGGRNQVETLIAPSLNPNKINIDIILNYYMWEFGGGIETIYTFIQGYPDATLEDNFSKRLWNIELKESLVIHAVCDKRDLIEWKIRKTIFELYENGAFSDYEMTKMREPMSNNPLIVGNIRYVKFRNKKPKDGFGDQVSMIVEDLRGGASDNSNSGDQGHTGVAEPGGDGNYANNTSPR